MPLSTLPTISLSALTAPEAAGTAAIGAEIGQAARDVGFFIIVDHGIDAGQIERTFAAARAFFALPEAAKTPASLHLNPHNRGWVRLGGEALNPALGADQKEAFNIGLDLPADDPEVLAGAPFRGVNIWPDLPGFRETMLAYFDAVWALGRRLHWAIATDLALPPLWFDDKLDAPLATLRLLRYPPASRVGSPVGAGEHTDYGNLTLLLTDDAGGLEVRRRDGTWIAPPHVPGAFIVNVGDCLMRWTNDVYQSTPHRVSHKAEVERISIPFFLDPNPDAMVIPLPGCVTPEHPARYAPITGAAYLKERLDATYAHRRAS